MEVTDQTNQNPESTQEEKPTSVNQTTDKKVSKSADLTKVTVQISSKEKQEIIDLLKGKAAETLSNTVIAAEKHEAKAELLPQLKDEEKAEIASLLKDGETTVVPDQAETPENKHQQLDESEKETIAHLLRDVQETEVEEEDIRQISPAERLEIRRLLGAKTDDADFTAIREKIDYESLNKQQLVEKLEEIVEEKDISKIKEDIGRIKIAFLNKNKEDINREKKQFIEDGGEESEFKPVVGPLEHRYNAAFNQYKQNKLKFAQELEKQKQENLQLKFQILEDLKILIDSEETLKKTYDEFKILQTRWKEIGMVPASELRNLWQNYHFLVERFFDKVKINKELRDLDMRKNMELKIKLCEKTEELLLEKSIVKSFKLLQKYHDKWREIGPAPSEYREDLWERFKTSTHKINQRRKEHYKEQQAEQQRNYEAKVAMCEQAEELLTDLPTTLKAWNQQTDKINNLLKLWKTIGRAARTQNDEIWARFKTSLDKFFLAKREFFGKLKEQQENNYNLKLDLCTQAEALKDSEDWNATTKALIDLQKEWKQTGPVSRRNADKVWKRFRSACDHFFNNKKEHFKNIHGEEDENLKLKESLIEEISNYKVSKDKTANLAALKNFQTRWMEAGFVPFKVKDKIQTQYREAIDQLINQMDIDKQELSASGFQSKVEMLKSAPDAGRRISKERNFISGKIKSLEDDLKVLENNIGFFSSSKQSNLLKEEFEKKIEKAKKEIDGLKDKLRMLDV
jgi:hypothetical protein